MNDLLEKINELIKEKELQLGNLTIYNDPTGELIQKYAKWQQNKGINVKIFSTNNFEISNCYNPFDYVYDKNRNIDDEKVSKIISLFLTTGSIGTGEYPYYENVCSALLTSIVYYMLETYQEHPEYICFSSLLDIIRCAYPFPTEDNPKTKLDEMMLELKKNNKQSKTCDWYEIFKMCPAKTANDIVVYLTIALQLFGDKHIKTLTKYDCKQADNNLNLYEIRKEKSVLYINTPPANSTFDFLVKILYTQLIDILDEPIVIINRPQTH